MMINHIVFFKLQDPSPANVNEAATLLRSMDGRVPMLRRIDVGVDVVRSPRSCDIVLVTVFDSLDDLAAYQADPYHHGVVAAHMRSVCSSITTVDYEA